MNSSTKKHLIFFTLLAASCVRPTKSVLGIPEFLEFGECLNATLVDDFDPIKYQGIWFDIQSVPNEYQQATKCTSQNYTWAGDRMISTGKGMTDEGKKVKQIVYLLQELELRDPPNPAHMTVSGENVPESPYQVIATDYATYSCVHSCLEYFGFKAEFFWVFGRSPSIPQEYITICHDALINMGADPTKMKPVPHGEFCPYHEKLDQMLEKNRQLLLQAGVSSGVQPSPPQVPVRPNTEAPKDERKEVVNVQRVSVMEVTTRPEEPESQETDEDDSFLEENFVKPQSPLATDSGSISTFMTTSNTLVPLFVLVAVLPPVVLPIH